YPRWPGDPAGNFVEAHVEAMRALGHDVDIIAAGDRPGRIPSPLFYRGGAPDELERGRGFVAAISFTARMTAAVMRRSRTGSHRRRSRRFRRAYRCSRSGTAVMSTRSRAFIC